MKKSFLTASLILTGLAVCAQVVTTDIDYITVEDSITLNFNSNEGNAGLAGVGAVYIHTGLVKDNSDYEGDWGNQRGIWGEADADLLPIQRFLHCC